MTPNFMTFVWGGAFILAKLGTIGREMGHACPTLAVRLLISKSFSEGEAGSVGHECPSRPTYFKMHEQSQFGDAAPAESRVADGQGVERRFGSWAFVF